MIETYSPALDQLSIEEETTQRLSFINSQGLCLPHQTEYDLERNREELFDALERIIGNTSVQNIALPHGIVKIKQEFNNPSGSHYDRVWLATIRELEHTGFIQPGDELREISSGSAGISLALIGGVLGYPVRLTLPPELPDNRVWPAGYFGAKIIRSSYGYVSAASAMQAEEISDLRESSDWTISRPDQNIASSFSFEKNERAERVCYLNHSENPISPAAHASIAQEILELEDQTTHVVLAIGNWTTIAGIAPILMREGIEVIGYSGSDVGGDGLTTNNFGTTVDIPGYSFKFSRTELSDRQTVSDKEVNRFRTLAPQLGRSSIMGLVIANRILGANSGARVISIGYDLANRY